MLSGGMQGCRCYGETKRGEGGPKLPIVAFHKHCKSNLLFILILKDRCVITYFGFFPFLLLLFFYFIFLPKLEKREWNKKLKHYKTAITKMWWLAWRKGDLYVVFDTLTQKSIPTANASGTDLLTNWLTDQQIILQSDPDVISYNML